MNTETCGLRNESIKRGRQALRACLLIILALSLAHCSDDSVGDSDDTCGGSCGPAEECSEGRCVPLIDAGGDVGGPDDAGGDGEDDSTADVGFPYRAPCDVNSDCRSGTCLSTFEGDFCSRQCATSADCGGADWDCFNLDAGSGERVDICAPRSNICSPCAVDINCSGGRCVDIEEGKFCMQDCSEDLDCPEGFSCQQLVVEENGEQVSVSQCKPDDGFCGDCVDKDGDGYGMGDGCFGPDCDDDDPSVFPGQLDGCDGFNVDCDDETDEDVLCTAAFADENVCVDGLCEVSTCEPGWSDCNGVFSDGCEVDLSSQTSCGGCRGIDEDVDCNQLSIDTGEGYQCGAVEDGEPGEFECQKTGCLNGFGICDSSASCVDLSLESHCGGGCTVCDDERGVVDGVCNVLSEAPFTAACRPAEGGCAEGFCDLDSFDTDCESIRLTERCGPSCDGTFVDCRNLPNTEGQTCDMDTGRCQFEACRPGFADCNDLVDDGCEASTFDRGTCTRGCFDCNDFVEDNGGTYHVNEVQNCGADGCNYVCDAGWGDCPVDGPTSPRDFLDGCETSLNQQTTCGSCFNDCSRRYPNSTGSCGEGDTAGVDATGCGLGSCTGPYVDADLELENGCECLPSGYDEPDVDGVGGYVDLNCDRIDGELSDSTFVEDGGEGDCLTRSNACGSIQQAIRAASMNDRSWVLVSRGVYEENIDLVSGISVAGGYGPNWERGDHREPAFQTTIAGEYRSDEDSYVTMRGDNYDGNLRNIRVDAPVISAESGPTHRANGDGYSTAAIVLTDGGESKWENLSIGLSNATHGKGGEDGISGWSQPAPNGADGADADNRDGGSGGAETTYTCGAASTAGGAGGSGGQGGILGVPGEAGSPGSCGENNPASGGSCGVGNQPGQSGDGGSGDESGERGENGLIGNDGDSGDGGSTTIVGLDPDNFQVSVEAATDGTVGSHGGGAGGGGGGGGSSRGLVGLSPTGGAGGGAGGAGGCAASSAGAAGRAGGHAIGVFTEGVEVTVNDIEIFGASAGDGGNGGAGAEGQPGGLGGESLATEAAPNGGIGGNGGRGGHSSGAGGGAGGHVIGVLAKGGTATADGIELLGGAPGTGGAGGSAPLSTLRGSDGSSGCRVTVYSCVRSTGCGDPCPGD